MVLFCLVVCQSACVFACLSVCCLFVVFGASVGASALGALDDTHHVSLRWWHASPVLACRWVL